MRTNNMPAGLRGRAIKEINMSDLIDRQQAIDICRAPHMRNADCSDFEMAIMMLPPAQPERIIRCKDCKHHWKHKCMDSMPIERCDLGQTFYDAEVDYCSLAKRREVTE